MRRRSPLATLLRVRRIQEDLARAEVSSARAAAQVAERRAAERAEAVSRARPVDGDPRTFVASLVAGRALAADAAAARRAATEAQGVVRDRLADWSGAASRAEGVGRVVTRHERELEAAEARREGAERDDLAAVAWTRRSEATRDRVSEPQRTDTSGKAGS